MSDDGGQSPCLIMNESSDNDDDNAGERSCSGSPCLIASENDENVDSVDEEGVHDDDIHEHHEQTAEVVEEYHKNNEENGTVPASEDVTDVESRLKDMLTDFGMEKFIVYCTDVIMHVRNLGSTGDGLIEGSLNYIMENQEKLSKTQMNPDWKCKHCTFDNKVQSD